MRKILLALTLCLGFLLPLSLGIRQVDSVTIDSPYMGYQYNIKGNLHAHSSFGGGGTETPSTVGAWYRDNGYGFYAITDHDLVTANPSVTGIAWMGGAEEDTSDGSSGHIGQIRISTPITSGTDQARIDNARGQGGFSILNHPTRVPEMWTAAEIGAFNNLFAMEIWNGGGDILATQTWDTVLSSGHAIWGVAEDDSHQASQHGDGYVTVNTASASPTAAEIQTQLLNGNFYASRVCDMSVSVSGSLITTGTTNGSQIRWIKTNGAVVKTTSGSTDRFVPWGDEGYLRIEILNSTGDPMAWSQPMTIPYSVTHPNGMLIKTASSSAVYLLEDGSRRYIPSPLIFNINSFSWDRIVTIEASEMASYLDGAPLDLPNGAVVKGSGPGCYLIDGNPGPVLVKPFATATSFINHGFRWTDIVQISDSQLASYLTAAAVYDVSPMPNGTVVKTAGSATVYLLEDNSRRPFSSGAAFTSRGFAWDRIVIVSDAEMSGFRDGDALYIKSGTVVKRTEPAVYIIDSDGAVPVKHAISSGDRLIQIGLHWEDLVITSDSELSAYTASEPL